MYETPRTEENPAAARTKLALARGVFQVWDAGELAPDEALREMLRILQGAFITPSGTQLRNAREDADRRYNAELSVYDNRPVPTIAAENWPAPVGGSPLLAIGVR